MTQEQKPHDPRPHDPQQWDALVHGEGDAAARAAAWDTLSPQARQQLIADRRLTVALAVALDEPQRRQALLPAVRLRLGSAQPAVRRRTVRNVRRRLDRPRLLVAAAALLAIGVLTVWWWPAATPAGQRWSADTMAVERPLPGGGRVHLAPGTVLRWSGDTRARPHLERGAVAITCDPRPADNPLLIDTAAWSVRVVGTRFWLRHDDHGSRIGVDHGVVEVSDAVAGTGGSTPQRLTAGQARASAPALRWQSAPPGRELLPPLHAWDDLDLEVRGTHVASDARGRALPAPLLANSWNADAVGRVQVGRYDAGQRRVRLTVSAGDGIQLYLRDSGVPIPPAAIGWLNVRYRSRVAAPRLVLEQPGGNQVHDLPATTTWRDATVPLPPGTARFLVQIPATATADAPVEITELVLRCETGP